MNTDLDRAMDMVQVIADICGNDIDDETAGVLLHVLCSGEITVQTQYGRELLPEHSQRHAGKVRAQVDSRHDYVSWLAWYNDKSGGNFYEMSPHYQPAIEKIVEQLCKHPSIVEINL